MTLLAKIRSWLHKGNDHSLGLPVNMDLRDPNQKPLPECENPPKEIKPIIKVKHE